MSENRTSNTGLVLQVSGNGVNQDLTKAPDPALCFLLDCLQ
jgi:hypothetical protein